MKTPCPKTKPGSAFSLVEMLVVTGIATLLLALLFPAVTRSLDSAKRTRCAANLRQIWMGLSHYASENNQKIPLVWDTANSGHEPWYDAACSGLQLPDDAWRQPKGLFHCPAAKTPSPNYTMSEAIDGNSVLLVTNAPRRVLISEGDGASSAGINDSAPFGGLDAKRHKTGANYLFVDGHVEFLTSIPTNSLTPPN